MSGARPVESKESDRSLTWTGNALPGTGWASVGGLEDDLEDDDLEDDDNNSRARIGLTQLEGGDDERGGESRAGQPQSR